MEPYLDFTEPELAGAEEPNEGFPPMVPYLEVTGPPEEGAGKE